MPVIKRIVRLALPIVAVFALLGAGGTYLYLESGLAGSRGRLRASGLEAPVEVIRDRWGVPHIYAQNEHDLYFAQGYVQAQDRLWQMEESRRAARGTLAEILGPQALAGDRLARTLGFARAAQAEWEALDPETRAVLEAYAQGVNAYLASGGRQLPLEFDLLRYAPEPWQPADTLAWARLHAWSQETAWQREVVRARLVDAVGAERAAELDPAIGRNPISTAQLEGLAACAQPLLMEGVGPAWPWASETGAGGVAWIADGTDTAGGGPMLAAAPRAPVQMPSPWYEMHLVGGRYDVAGATLPGMPGVLIGRNRTIAWSLAGSAVDSADLYVERVRGGDTPQVLYQDQWESVQVREEQIRVRGQSEPIRLRVGSTRHGVIVSSLEAGQELQIALRWLGAELETTFARCLPALNRAQNWGEVEAALAGWGAPGQMLVYADTQGNVAYAVAGTGPRRTSAGNLPVPGWTGECEWQGAVQSEDLPRGLVQNAGPLVALDGQAGVEQGPEAAWESARDPFAVARIAELAESTDGLTVQDAWGILCDDAGPDQPLLSLLLSHAPQGWIQERTVPYLRRWDGRYDRESAGAGVYEAFCWRLAHNTFDDDLGPELVDAYLNANSDHHAALATLAGEADSPWFDDRRTPQREGRDEIVARSFAEGLDGLGRRFGDLPYEWNWGRVHSITFTHALGSRWPLTMLLNRGAMRAGGGASSVDAVLPDYGRRMVVGSAPTYRLVVDLSEGGEALAVNAPGQSGNPLSPHYADMIEPWREGRYHPLLLERQAIVAAARATLILTPVD